MNVGAIKVQQPFSTLFPVSQVTLAAITADMRRNGYDPAQPIVVWGDVCIDGHTRLEAAIVAGLEDVPVAVREFEDDDAAIRYAIHTQRDRRTLTDADIARLVRELDKRRDRGGDHGNQHTGGKEAKISSEVIAKPSAEVTAEIIGTSRAKVEKSRAVNDRGTPEVRAAVESGEMTINKAYNETQAKRKAAVEAEEKRYEGRTPDPMDKPKDNANNKPPEVYTSETMAGLKRYWKQANKKERKTFLEWTKSYEN